MTTEIGQRIVCAANRLHLLTGETYLVLGARHWDPHMHRFANALKRILQEKFPYEKKLWRHDIKTDQGFVDQRNNFLTREEAWKVAEAAGQILRVTGEEGVLYSEDLY